MILALLTHVIYYGTMENTSKVCTPENEGTRRFVSEYQSLHNTFEQLSYFDFNADCEQAIKSNNSIPEIRVLTSSSTTFQSSKEIVESSPLHPPTTLGYLSVNPISHFIYGLRKIIT